MGRAKQSPSPSELKEKQRPTNVDPVFGSDPTRNLRYGVLSALNTNYKIIYLLKIRLFQFYPELSRFLKEVWTI